MNRCVPLLLVITIACPAAAAEPPARRAERAAALHARAIERLARNSFDERRMAARDLEQAELLDPANPAHPLALARLYYGMGHLRLARGRFEAAARLAPDDAAPRLGLGLVARREWLKFLDRSALALAVVHLRDAVSRDPGLTEAWLHLVPLLVESADLRAAAAAAARAVEADAERGEAPLAMAYVAYRRGEVERADSLFAAALPRLPREARARFDDIAPVATAADTAALRRLPAEAQRAFVETFWKRTDPDLATPENEARLEYWSRVAHAYFLFFDPRRREWDQRGELYVRYGPPAALDYNPLGMRLSWQFATGPSYPANLLVWSWPDLGLRVVMEDRTLNEIYRLPISREQDMDPVVDAATVDSLGDRLASGGGRAVFPQLPPGARPRPVESLFARFAGGSDARALGALTTPAAGGEEGLEATWVVLDSAGNEVRRERRGAAASACEPGLMGAGFTADLPPGRYLLGLTVRDGAGRRGLARSPFEVGPPRAALELSDVLVTCGVPDPEGPAAAAGPEPHVGRRVTGAAPLTAYFEVYDLATGAGGRSRFQLTYSVRAAGRDRRNWVQRWLAPRAGTAPIVVTRDEEQAGNLRRQYLSIPVDRLAPGRYRLEVRVVDLLSGEEARGGAEFTREAAVAAGP